MKIDLEDPKDQIYIPMVTLGENYLNICAHCGECLKQIVTDPNKLNVVLHYRDEMGDIVRWNPDSQTKQDEGGSLCIL